MPRFPIRPVWKMAGRWSVIAGPGMAFDGGRRDQPRGDPLAGA